MQRLPSPYTIPGMKEISGVLEPPPMSIRFIKEVCAEEWKVTVEEMESRSRERSKVEARQVAMFLLARYSRYTLKHIGEQFNVRDHTTVIHARATVTGLIQFNADFRNKVNRIISKYFNVDQVGAAPFRGFDRVGSHRQIEKERII